MRYNVTFNQQELMAYNDKQPKKKKIDIKDAIILQQLYHLSTWEAVETKTLEDGVFFWAAYGKLITELPALGFSTNDSISKRIKNKLLKNGLLKLFVDWNDNSKTYWQFTEPGKKIAQPGKDPLSRSDEWTRGGRMNGREGVGQLDERGSDERTDNYTSIDYTTNDERENLSHFEFWKKNFKNDYSEWEKENTSKIYDLVNFIHALNNKLQSEGFSKSERLTFRIKDFTRHWIKNQTEDERPAQQKPKNFLSANQLPKKHNIN